MLASTLVDAGQIDYAVVVAAEDASKLQAATVANLHAETTHRGNFMEQFASLTLGSGAAAAVVGRIEDHPDAIGSSAGSPAPAPTTTACAWATTTACTPTPPPCSRTVSSS